LKGGDKLFEDQVEDMADLGHDPTPSYCNARVVERLRELVPLKEPFTQITSATKADEFWRLVDALPSHISLEIHALAAMTPTTDRDFPRDTFAPFYQDLWVAHRECPEFRNPAAVSQISQAAVEDVLRQQDGWSDRDDFWFCRYSSVGFEMRLLMNMCNAFAVQGKPWLFCPIDEIRCAYMDFDRVVEKFDTRYDSTAIQAKLRSFHYSSTEEFVADAKPFSSSAVLSKLGEFRSSQELGAALARLLKAASAALCEPSPGPAIDEIDDWKRTRAEALLSQMSLPLEQRAAFSLSAQVLRARTGQPADTVFERGSLAELLFTNSYGDVMPLPFTNCRSELPSGSPIPLAKTSFRSFVAKQLLKNGYTSATQSVMDILTDVVVFEIRKIGLAAATVKEGSKADSRTIMQQALKSCCYDPYTLRAPHL
jgi:hypothetical protein